MQNTAYHDVAELDVKASIIGRLKRFNTPQYWAWFVACSIILTNAILLANGLGNLKRKPVYFDEDRNYTLIPFDQLDAENICESETHHRFGDDLLRTNVDFRSSRFDQLSGNYKIFMNADLGNIYIFDEMTVHCFVDPSKYRIDHYRAIYDKKQSLMKRAMKILGLDR